MSNNRNDIISFGDIVGRVAWQSISTDPIDGTSWTMAKEWNKRRAAMTMKNDRGEATTFRLPSGDEWALLHNPLSGSLTIVWSEFGIDRMFVADGKPVTVVEQVDAEGRTHSIITATADGIPGDLAGTWPLAKCDESARRVVAEAGQQWAVSQGRARRYSDGTTATGDGGFFPRVPVYVGVLSSLEEWESLTRDLRSWSMLMQEAIEAGFDPKSLDPSTTSHLADLQGW